MGLELSALVRPCCFSLKMIMTRITYDNSRTCLPAVFVYVQVEPVTVGPSSSLHFYSGFACVCVHPTLHATAVMHTFPAPLRSPLLKHKLLKSREWFSCFNTWCEHVVDGC